MNKLENEKAINLVENDKLGRADFAKHIAIKLLELPTSENSFVIALQGKWGDGKSSLINLIKYYIDQEFQNIHPKWSLRFIQAIKRNSFKISQILTNIENVIIKALFCYLILNFNVIQFITSIKPIAGFIFNVVSSFTFSLNLEYMSVIFDFLFKLVIILGFLFWKKLTISSLLAPNIKYIKNLIKKHSKKPIIIDFTPWNLTDDSQLYSEFFDVLSENLNCSYKPYIDNYVKQLCNNLTKGILPNIETYSILTYKQYLIDSLKQENKKIIIFIDDLDRLPGESIYKILKLINSIANFPNIIFFMSYDKDIVCEALCKYDIQCNKFLEKIVQASINIPQIIQYKLEIYLLDKITKLIKFYFPKDDDWFANNDYWEKVYNSGFSGFFKNIRDIIRFTNTFKLRFCPKIKDEINITDFLVITALQLFTPELFVFIQKYSGDLTAESATLSSDETKAKLKKELDNVIEKYENEYPSIKNLLETIFPMIENIYHNVNYYDINAAKEYKISSAYHFQKYFILDQIEGDLSKSEIVELLESTNNTQSFSDKLFELDKKGLVKVALNWLEIYIKDIPQTPNAYNIIKVFFDIGDELRWDENDFFITKTQTKLVHLIFKLLEQNLSNKFNIIFEAIQNNKSIYPAVHYLGKIQRSLEKLPNSLSQNYIDSNNYSLLRDIVIKDIEKWAFNDAIQNNVKESPFNERLEKHPQLVEILYFWKRNSNGVSLEKYILSMMYSDTHFIKFLDKFQTEVHSYSEGKSSVYFQFNYKDFEAFFDINFLTNKLININKNLLSKHEIEVLEKALKTLTREEKDEAEF